MSNDGATDDHLLVEERSKLAEEIRRMKEFRKSLVHSIEILQQRIRDETTLRRRLVDNLKRVLSNYDNITNCENTFDDDLFKEFAKEYPNLVNCTTGDKARDIMTEILLEYETKSTFSLSELLTVAKNDVEADEDGDYGTASSISNPKTDSNPASSLYMLSAKNSPVSFDEETWAERWKNQFRSFTVVNEHGVPLPEPLPNEDENKKVVDRSPLTLPRLVDDLHSDRYRYILASSITTMHEYEYIPSRAGSESDPATDMENRSVNSYETFGAGENRAGSS